jgi:hypothetical protein
LNVAASRNVAHNLVADDLAAIGSAKPALASASWISTRTDPAAEVA